MIFRLARDYCALRINAGMSPKTREAAEKDYLMPYLQ